MPVIWPTSNLSNPSTFEINQESLAIITESQPTVPTPLTTQRSPTPTRLFNYKALYALMNITVIQTPRQKSQQPKTRKIKHVMHNDLAGESCLAQLTDASHQHSKGGHSLLELMICIAIIGVIAGFASQHLNQQMGLLQLQRVAHAFIQDAQLARQLSRQLGHAVTMKPFNPNQSNEWGLGWVIGYKNQHEFITLKEYSLTDDDPKRFVVVANDLLKDSQQFTDISAPGKARHLTFKNGQAALMNNGGFVANRIIWQHQHHPNLQIHVILGPGGRWRSCNPQRDTQKCL